MPRPAVLLLAVGVLVAPGCGDEGDGGSDSISGGADPEAVEVIEGWADELRGGNVEAAAEFWALPSIAQNGTPPIELTSRRDVIAFNKALPCGAVLSRAETEEEFVVATFELTERPGAGRCGPGTGETARTAFLISDGKIVEWRRIADEEGLPAPEGPIV